MSDALKKFIDEHIYDIAKEGSEKAFLKALEELDKKDFGEFIEYLCENNFSIPVFGTNEVCFEVYINTAKKSSYVQCADLIRPNYIFEDWIDELGLPSFPHTKLTVEFSDEKKTNTYGNLTVEELKNIIRKKYGSNEKIEEILNKIHSKEDFKRLLEELLCELHRIFGNQNVHNFEDISCYFKDLEFKMDILGSYMHGSKRIILYTKNIEKSARKLGVDPKDRLMATFIHELFHAYHYANDKGELANREDYTSSVVKESLASAFEWLYCFKSKLNSVCDDLYKSWYRSSVLHYPYSGAMELVDDCALHCTLNDKKFRDDVFIPSLTNVDVALRNLLDDSDFYRIKNAKSVVKKYAGAVDLRKAFDDIMKVDTIGRIAQREIPSILKKKGNRYLINDLLDVDYCDKTFKTGKYSVLTTALVSGKYHPMSYAEPIKIGGNEFYLYSQWTDRNLEPLLDWIWKHR